MDKNTDMPLIITLDSNNPDRAKGLFKLIQTQEFSMGLATLPIIQKQLYMLKEQGAHVEFKIMADDICTYNALTKTFSMHADCTDIVLGGRLAKQLCHSL